MDVTKHARLGRLYAPDPRDKKFSVSALGAPQSERMYRYWNADGWWGDQGMTSECVAYSWCAWLEDGPITQPGLLKAMEPHALYVEAQKVDEWEGEAYDGTSVRAGAKVLRAAGLIEGYYWATTLNQVVQSLLELGPLVVGTSWYDEMFDIDEAGFLNIGGEIVGGHAYKLDGVNVKRKVFRMKNSWGRNWGHNGFALLSFDDFDRLLSEEGEACIAREIKKVL